MPHVERSAALHLTVAGVAAVLATAFWAQSASMAIAADSPCRAESFEGRTYTVCEIDLRRQTVRLFWKSQDGQPYSFLDRLPATQGNPEQPLLFAANAGMFAPDYSPVGLYIENGEQLVAASTRSGYGNFHLKPNGVFYIAGNSADVVETGSYLRRKLKADFATQSGPMLVVNGKLHPAFVEGSASLKRRDGVGVRDPHTVLFAISDDGVTFSAFARLFRDRLKCSNALFLDGGPVPTLYRAATKEGSNRLPMGPMLGVFKRKTP
jgi:uncharacterized protein YigE (DUF2233 family)